MVMVDNCWTLLEAGQVERRQRASSLLAAGADVVRRRDHPALAAQVAVGPERTLLGEFRSISPDRRNGVGVRILDVDVERPRTRIFKAADRVIGRRHAVDRNALQLVGILLEIGEAENTDGAGI